MENDQANAQQPYLDASDPKRKLVAGLIAEQATDASANPVLSFSNRLNKRLANGEITIADIADLIRTLRDSAFVERAARLKAYVGGTAPENTDARIRDLARRLIRGNGNGNGNGNGAAPSFEAARNALELTRFAAVFTAHPTFALSNPVYAALAEIASAPDTEHTAPAFTTHRRDAAPTLEEEFTLASEAILRGRDALDKLTHAILTEARERWPKDWTTLAVRPIILTSWVGYDTDGRTDIGWWDTLRLRLRMKLFHLQRLHAQIDINDACVTTLRVRLETAIDTVSNQIAKCPTSAEPKEVSIFSEALIDGREDAIASAGVIDSLLRDAIDRAPDDHKMDLLVARAGFNAHGMGAAHTHTRLNSTQLHNVVRQRLNITDSPETRSRRRALLNRINDALDLGHTVPVDFGMLLGEQASAGRLMMTIAQITKHIDMTTPVRFLIAETESGYTLLCALWLSRLFGIQDHQIEISPLFETPEALERGETILEEALRSPHWRAYLRRTGKLCLQFGYSDSGRYVGQLAATYLVERLRLKTLELLRKHGLSGIQVVLFDTHGESIGRGAHPFKLADRLDYLSPRHARALFAESGIAVREESAFQGGDGYLLFGSKPLADATITTIAEHVFEPATLDRDPVYDEPDFSADFFTTIAMSMGELVEDPGYAALLGAFGPSLIDKTGSRPSARQSDSAGTTTRITHPSQLRAIPNNAILQQLGWCANTLQGLGAAAQRHPDTFENFLSNSPRFKRALDFAVHACRYSDPAVLRAMIYLLDPNMWLDRAAAEKQPEKRLAMLQLMRGLEKFGFWASSQAMYRRIQADHLILRSAWPDAPTMTPSDVLLHGVRVFLIEKIWTLASEIPYFSPRGAFTRDAMLAQILCLEIPALLKQMDVIFPNATTTLEDLDFHEAPGPRDERAYEREHANIFKPMAEMFALIREISVAVMHGVGAFG